MGHNPLTPPKVMRNAHLLSTPCMSGVEQVPGLCGFLLSPTHWTTSQENAHFTDEVT